MPLSQVWHPGFWGECPHLGLQSEQEPLCPPVSPPLWQVEEVKAVGLGQAHVTSFVRAVRRALKGARSQGLLTSPQSPRSPFSRLPSWL